MRRLDDLGFLFRVVAVVELFYALAALTPPDLVTPLTGWVLNADGQWLIKILSAALASQAWVAWTLRHQPHRGVARGLAFYQFASATADWVMWIVLADQGVFSTVTARILVLIAIPSHYLLGVLLVRALRSTPAQALPDDARLLEACNS